MAKKWSGFLPQNEEIREKWSELLESPPAEESAAVEVKVTATPGAEQGDLEATSLDLAEPVPIHRKD